MANQEIINSVTDYVTTKLIPNEHKNPEVFRQEFINAGFFKIGHSEDAGGLGLNLEDLIRVQMQFGRTKLGFRNIFSTTTTLASWMLEQTGNLDILDEVGKGAVVSMAYTEPEKTSSTTYESRQGNNFINGTKRYISNSVHAKYFITFAKDTLFLVPREEVKVGSNYEKMGQELNPVADVYFDNSKANRIIGEQGRGLRLSTDAFTRGRLIVSAVCTGMAMRLCDEMTAYAKERGVFKHQLVQGLIAEAVAKTFAARSSVIEAAKNLTPLNSSCAKLICTNAANEVADNAVQVLGGYGYMRGHIVEEFYRDARLFRLYEGTDEIQKLAIAKNYKQGIINEYP